MPDADALMWWGYIHTNDTIQVKRYFGPEDIEEAKESPFVQCCHGPFEANSRREAKEKLVEHFRSINKPFRIPDNF